MTVCAIVQARVSSSRFPGKVLAPLRGVPLAVYILRRLEKSKRVDTVMLATSTAADDAPLAETVERAGFRVYRGRDYYLSPWCDSSNESTRDSTFEQ